MDKVERRIRRIAANVAPNASEDVIKRCVEAKKRDDLRNRASHAMLRDAYQDHMKRFHGYPGAPTECEGDCQW